MSLPKSIKIGYAVFSEHIHMPELLRAHSAQLFDWIVEVPRIILGACY
jgi:NADPH2:quinone reductase